MPQRIPPATRRELGPVNWVIAKAAARAIRVPEFHLFTTLGQHKALLPPFLVYSAFLLYRGKLSMQDKELVILRVGRLRNSEYELQQHRRLARTRGLDNALQAKIFAGPDADGLTDRQRTLLRAVDEFISDRDLSDTTFAALSRHLSRQQVIEFCALAGNYDSIAATAAALRVPLDFPD